MPFCSMYGYNWTGMMQAHESSLFFLTKVFAKLCSTSSQFPAFGLTDRNGCQLFVVHPTRVDVEVLGGRKTCPLGLHCGLHARIDQLMYK